MAKKALSILFFVFSASLYAQPDNYYRDSLLNVINHAEHDTVKLKAVSFLYQYYFNIGDNQSSLKYCQQALKLATSSNAVKAIPRIKYSIGLNYTMLIQYDSAKFYLDESQKLALEINDVELAAHSYHATALWLSFQSDYSSAVEYLMRCAEIMEKNPDSKFKLSLAQVYCDLGYNLISENQIEKGIEYELRALTYKNYRDELRYKVLICLNLTDGYIKLKQLPVAKQYLDSALVINKKLDNKPVAIMAANTEGYYYQNVHDDTKALAAYLTAYHLSDSLKMDGLKAESGDNISRILFNQKNSFEAERFATEANGLGRPLKLFKIVASTYGLLKTIAEQKGNYIQALRYAELNKVYADSATNANTQQVTLALESKYQNQRKEKQILELKTANTERELAVVKRNRLSVIGGLSAITLIVILGLLYRNSKQKQILAENEHKLQQEQIKFLERQQQVVSLQSMINGQEAERTRIAKDLHDGLGGLFSTVKMHFSTLQYQINDLKQNDLFQKSYQLVDTASLELRRIAHNMMPEVLMKLGLINAIQDLCDNVSAGKLLKVWLRVYGMEKRLNPSTEIMLYRIIQELLNNTIKHAHATEATIQFTRDGKRLSVVVEDNGRGFNTLEADERGYAGMETIKSRVTYLDGKLTIDSQKDLGTTVMMDFLIHE